MVAERRESWQRAVTDKEWRLYSVYEVTNNRAGVKVVRGHGVSRDYYPMAYPRLPFELAQVGYGDTDSTLEFVHKWGLLGYNVLFPESERRSDAGWYNDDPTDFIWAHAHTVRSVLALYSALRRDDATELAEAMKALAQPSHFPDYPEDVPDHVRDAPWWAHGEGIALFDPRYWVPEFGYVRSVPPPGYGPEEVVAETIAEFISGNLPGIRPIVNLRDPVWMTGPQGGSAARPLSRLRTMYLFDALVQAVWWHLANFVSGERDLAKCRECGHYFERTDKRQEFCPPPEEHALQARHGQRARAVSLCASRNRTRRRRSKANSGH